MRTKNLIGRVFSGLLILGGQVYGCAVPANAFVCALGRSNDRGVTTIIEEQQQKFHLGFQIGAALTHGSSIFVGRVYSIGDNEESVSNGSVSTVSNKLVVDIEEWLWNKQATSNKQIQLTYITTTNPDELRQGPWSIWQGVKVQVGERLLLVLDHQKPTGQNYAIIISEQRLFSKIKDIVFLHQQYVQAPAKLLEAPEVLRTTQDDIFGGYLVSCLRSAQYTGSVDNEALVLSKLLGNKQIPEDNWGWLRVSLKWRLGKSQRISPITRNLINETLIINACSPNSTLALHTIIILSYLSDNKLLDMRQFLDKERQQKIINNYRMLIRERKLSAQTNFEAQLINFN